MSTAREETICVAVRIRPMGEKEIKAGHREAWKVCDNRIYRRDNREGGENRSDGEYDFVFGAGIETIVVYEKLVKNIVTSYLEGINGTVFAYGQTSSGKTYSMRGIASLALQEIFAGMSKCHEEKLVCTLDVSYLEVYNEIVHDLLQRESPSLRICDNIQGESTVDGLTQIRVDSIDQVLNLMRTGEGRRRVSRTAMNAESSRSHAILKMSLRREEIKYNEVESGDGDSGDGDQQDTTTADNTPKAFTNSVLHLVDLAGSERACNTEAEGMRLREGSHINKSLLSLGLIIRKLAEASSSNTNSHLHLPYRDSKLTRILRPALGGNTRTAMLCCVTPSTRHVDETQSTLRFASRARAVKNRYTKNMEVTPEAIIKKLRRENRELRKRLAEAINTTGKRSSEALTPKSSRASSRRNSTSRRHFEMNGPSIPSAIMTPHRWEARHKHKGFRLENVKLRPPSKDSRWKSTLSDSEEMDGENRRPRASIRPRVLNHDLNVSVVSCDGDSAAGCGYFHTTSVVRRDKSMPPPQSRAKIKAREPFARIDLALNSPVFKQKILNSPLFKQHEERLEKRVTQLSVQLQRRDQKLKDALQRVSLISDELQDKDTRHDQTIQTIKDQFKTKETKWKDELEIFKRTVVEREKHWKSDFKNLTETAKRRELALMRKLRDSQNMRKKREDMLSSKAGLLKDQVHSLTKHLATALEQLEQGRIDHQESIRNMSAEVEDALARLGRAREIEKLSTRRETKARNELEMFKRSVADLNLQLAISRAKNDQLELKIREMKEFEARQKEREEIDKESEQWGSGDVNWSPRSPIRHNRSDFRAKYEGGRGIAHLALLLYGMKG